MLSPITSHLRGPSCWGRHLLDTSMAELGINFPLFK